jgi:hypothetical protein
MFKDTCLIALKRKDRSPRILDLEILVYLLLEVFVYLILKSLYIGFEMTLLTLKHTITQM